MHEYITTCFLCQTWSRELATSDTWASRVVVVVSHDRCFIEDACTDMMHISGVAKRLTQHPGRYSTWVKRREEQQVGGCGPWKVWRTTTTMSRLTPCFHTPFRHRLRGSGRRRWDRLGYHNE